VIIIKKRVTTVASLLACVCLICISCISAAINNNGQRQSVVSGYDFPVKPGTAEWINLGTMEERVKACQISDDILKKMSTDELIETVLDYPYMGDLYAFNSYNIGFDVVTERFNGMRELLSRNDLAAKLLLKYQNTDIIRDVKDITNKKILDLDYIETLLDREKILSKFSKEQLKDLVKEKAQKNKLRSQHPDIYGVTQ
jgi:hypothetical protein